MEMRPNKTTGSPGRTHRFLDTNVCPQCLSWPFGYGESYTTFSLAWTAPFPTSVSAGDETAFALTLTNTGGLVGDVVVTCYVVAVKQSAVKHPPLQQLFAFERAESVGSNGGTAVLAFTLTPEGRTLVTEEGTQVAAAGDFKVLCTAGGVVTISANLTVL
jgi:beta-glucosidase